MIAAKQGRDIGYLKLGLALILVLVGIKLALADIYQVPLGIALGVIAFILTLAIVALLLFPPKEPAQRDDQPM